MVDGDEVFARVSLDSGYREHAREQREGRAVLLDDDRALFRSLMKNALAELWMRLGRMGRGVDKAVRYTEDMTTLRLEVGTNHDDNMLFALGSFIGQFTDAWILRQWFDRNQQPGDALCCERDAAGAWQNILTLVHYRKKAVKRPVDPVL